MKKLTLLSAVIILMMGSCNIDQKGKPSFDPKTEKEKIMLVLERYIIANETQNLDLVKQVWAPKDDIVVIGTNYDEMLIGWDNIKIAVNRQFESFEDTYISVHDQIIGLNDTGNTAWFSEIVNYNYIYQGKARQYEGLRFTGVLEKENDEWLIVQSHLSIPGTPD
jgi:hypothetical protein